MSMFRPNKSINEEINSVDKIEKKHLEYLIDACGKLTTHCNKRELKVYDLKWQPSHTTVFKQIKTQLEAILNSDTSKNLDVLNGIPYLLCIKNEMFKLFSHFSKYLTDYAQFIGEPETIHRNNFFTTIVHYQFLVLELQDYFPSGVYTPNSVKITKLEARTWWETNFPNQIFVQKDEFMKVFRSQFNLCNQADIISFQNCLNFTKTDIVTTFEFDLITRLYGPWDKFIEVWRTIFHHPAYLHFSTYSQTRDKLNKHQNRPGTYVFRVSCKDLGCWTVGYVKSSKEIGQIKVDRSNLIESLVDGKRKQMYLYPNGNTEDRDLTEFINHRKEVVVSQETLDLYTSFDDFKECKICRANEKNLQMESCGHQICDTCFTNIMKNMRKVCPFCNQKVKSTTKISNIREIKEDMYVHPSNGSNGSYTEVKNDVNENHYIECQSQNDQTDKKDDEQPPPLPPLPNEFGSTVNRANNKTTVKYPINLNTKSKVELPTPIPRNSPRPPLPPPLPPTPDSIYCMPRHEDVKPTPTSNRTSDNHQTNASADLTYIPLQSYATNNINSNDSVYSDPIDPPEPVEPIKVVPKKRSSVPRLSSEDKPVEVFSPPPPPMPTVPMVFNSQVQETGKEENIVVCRSQPHQNNVQEDDDDDDDDDDVDVYCDNIEESYPEMSGLWTDADIDRALRVANGNIDLARDILLEFVPKLPQ